MTTNAQYKIFADSLSSDIGLLALTQAVQNNQAQDPDYDLKNVYFLLERIFGKGDPNVDHFYGLLRARLSPKIGD